jgi:hypothetical protein
MEIYTADDVAVALNSLFENVVAPLIASHPHAESFCERLEAAVEDAAGSPDPSVGLQRQIVRRLVDAARREMP